MLRVKDEEPDYRFFQDPDLPAISITDDRVQAVRQTLGEVPFELKHKFCKTYGMDIADVKIIFRNVWSIPLFQSIVSKLKMDPNVVF